MSDNHLKRQNEDIGDETKVEERNNKAQKTSPSSDVTTASLIQESFTFPYSTGGTLLTSDDSNTQQPQQLQQHTSASSSSGASSSSTNIQVPTTIDELKRLKDHKLIVDLLKENVPLNEQEIETIQKTKEGGVYPLNALNGSHLVNAIGAYNDMLKQDSKNYPGAKKASGQR